MIKFSVSESVFNSVCMFFGNVTREDLIKEFKKVKIINPNFELVGAGKYLVYSRQDKKYTYTYCSIIIPKLELTPAKLAIIGHEVLHHVYYVGEEQRVTDEQTLCYLFEFYYREIMKTLFKLKSKKKL